jgi:hypothetical protein
MTTAQRQPQPATPHGPLSRYVVLSRSAQAPSYRRRIPDDVHYPALRSFHSSEDSSAPGRGLMPGGAGQLSSGGGGQGLRRRCRHRGAVLGGRAPPGAVTWARSGRPAGGRRREDVRTPARLVVALSAPPVPPWGCPSSRSSGRPTSRRPVSTRPVSRRPPHPGVRTDTLRCPRRCRHVVRAALIWSGSVWRAAPGWAQPVDVPRGRRAAWSPAGLGPDGKGGGGVGRGWLARGSTLAQGRRVAGVAAAAPPWPQRADTGAGPGQGAGRGGEHGGAWEGAGAHRPRPGVLGALVGVVPTRGLDQQLVTTLRGRWARVVPWRPAPEGPPGSVGEQPAAAARPRRVRSAVG